VGGRGLTDSAAELPPTFSGVLAVKRGGGGAFLAEVRRVPPPACVQLHLQYAVLWSAVTGPDSCSSREVVGCCEVLYKCFDPWPGELWRGVSVLSMADVLLSTANC
jgi:hypothetical protein